MGKRLALKQYRVGLDKSQQEFADGMGYNRGFYGKVEAGKQNGTLEFWRALQDAYSVPDEKNVGVDEMTRNQREYKTIFTGQASPLNMQPVAAALAEAIIKQRGVNENAGRKAETRKKTA